MWPEVAAITRNRDHRRLVAGGALLIAVACTQPQRLEMVVPGVQTRAFAVDDEHLYWIAGGALARVPSAGGPVETIASGDEVLVEPINDAVMALDEGYVYWWRPRRNPAGEIVRVPKQGGATQHLASTDHIVRAFHVSGGMVVWSEGGVLMASEEGDVLLPARVRWVPADGGTATTIWEIAEEGQVLAAAVDAARLYFTWNTVTGSRVYAAPRGGGDPEMLATFAGVSIPALALDESFLYWVQSTGYTVCVQQRSPCYCVARTALAGGPASCYATVEGTGPGFASALVVDDTGIYFDSYRAPREGGAAILLLGHLVWPRGLAVDDTHVYFPTYDGLARLDKRADPPAFRPPGENRPPLVLSGGPR